MYGRNLDIDASAIPHHLLFNAQTGVNRLFRYVLVGIGHTAYSSTAVVYEMDEYRKARAAPVEFAVTTYASLCDAVKKGGKPNVEETRLIPVREVYVEPDAPRKSDEVAIKRQPRRTKLVPISEPKPELRVVDGAS